MLTGRSPRAGNPVTRRQDQRPDDGRTAAERRGSRGDEIPRVPAPPIPDEVEYGQLDKEVRARMRTLSKDNAEDVGRHLVMVGALLDDDPELAYLHAQVAVARGGRVDVVREAAALAAYATGRYAEALRELRTVRRLNGEVRHLPLMADCERGLGRPERAITLAQSEDARQLDPAGKAEMAMVLAGARSDMGDHAAALAALRAASGPTLEIAHRLTEAMAEALLALGREDEAQELVRTLPEPEKREETTVVYDVDEDAPFDADPAADEPLSEAADEGPSA